MAMISGVNIQNISFSPGMVEISYSEDRDVDQRTSIFEIRTIVIPVELVEQSFADLMDSALQLIDEAKTVQRNPRAVLRS